MDKRRPPFDSARQIGPEIPFDRALFVDTACYTGGKKVVSGIFHIKKPGVLACSSRPSGAVDQWRPLFDSAHKIGPETPFHGVLIVVGPWFTGGRKRFGPNFYLRNLRRFHL